MTHVTEKLSELVKRAKLTRPKLAVLIGMQGASSIQRYFSQKDYKSDYLPNHLVSKLADVLPGRGDPPISEEEIFALAEPLASRERYLPSKLPDAARLLQATTDAIDAYGSAVGGLEGYVEMGRPIERVPCPPNLADVPGAYALYVDGDVMEPRYYAGELVYVHPTKPPVRGRYVVVQMKKTNNSHNKSTPPYAIVRQLVSRTAKELVVRQLNPESEEKIPLERIVAVHRVLSWGEA